MRLLFIVLIAAAVTVATFWAGSFGWGPIVITNEYEHKILLFLGSPQRAPISAPGLTLRLPLLETVETLDKRLQYLDADPVELLIGSETLLVDYYAIWRITDPLQFRRSYPGGMPDAEKALQRRLRSRVAAIFGRLPLEQLLARARVVDDLGGELSATLAAKGVEVLDVRINRTELPHEVETAAYSQMREQRRAISRTHRARGDREARETRAKAKREARTLVADARSKAEITRGEGDAQAAAIYGAAYGKDPEFYAFVRSLEAYRATLGERTTLILSPEHEFLRFLASDGVPAVTGPVASPPPIAAGGP